MTDATQPEEARVLAANEAFYDAFNTRDLPAMDALWARDVPVACTHPGWAAVQGRVKVLTTWAAILGNPEQPRIVAGAAQAFVSGTSAWVLGRELFGGSPLAATNLFTLEQGEWRLVHHHSSPVSFLAEDLQ